MRHVVYNITDATMWGCWAVAAVVWITGASRSRHQRASSRASEPDDRASLAAAAIALAALITPAPLWRPLVVATPWLRLGGAGLLVLATAYAVWARLALGTMWSSRALVAEQHELRTDGPYAITRHPIYTGILAMVAASAVTQGIGRWAAIMAAVGAALLFKIRAEERMLLREFPHEYRHYQEQVPRLLPALRLRQARRERTHSTHA